MKLFSVHDQASKTYINPFCMLTERDALEGFRVVVNDKTTNYSKFPADFTLVCLGEFDIRTAEFKIYEKPQILKNATGVKDANL